MIRGLAIWEVNDGLNLKNIILSGADKYIIIIIIFFFTYILFINVYFFSFCFPY